MNIKNFIPSLYQLQSPNLIPDRPSPATLDQLAQYLNYLQTDIKLLHRELTYWDIYKINYVIKDISEYNSIINNLLPGQTAVIGFKQSEIVNGVRRSRGDLIVRLLNNDLFEIPSLSSGIYVPSSYTDNQWHFIYTNDTPKEGTSVDITVTSQAPGDIYGHVVDIAQIYTYTFADKNGVKPLIRFYTADNEIIDLPFSVTFEKKDEEDPNDYDKWIINWTAINPLATIMQVK